MSLSSAGPAWTKEAEARSSLGKKLSTAAFCATHAKQKPKSVSSVWEVTTWDHMGRKGKIYSKCPEKYNAFLEILCTSKWSYLLLRVFSKLLPVFACLLKCGFVIFGSGSRSCMHCKTISSKLSCSIMQYYAAWARTIFHRFHNQLGSRIMWGWHICKSVSAKQFLVCSTWCCWKKFTQSYSIYLLLKII